MYTQTPVDAGYVVASGTYWGLLQAERHAETAAEFHSQSTSLGFTDHEAARMWARLSQIAVIAGTGPAKLTPTGYATARAALLTAMTQRRGHLPRTLSTPLFGLDAVMFHRGQAGSPPPKTRPLTPAPEHIDWDQISTRAPALAATMARYLRQLSISLRPGSVALVETTLRQLAAMLVTDHPHVYAVADIDRVHIEAYKAILAARAGYRGRPTVSKTTIGMRLGHLRGFFDRIIEWAYPDAPTRNPVYRSDTPIKDRPLPRFLDDDQASALMAAARALPDPLDRLIVTVLARTGMRKGELLGLTVDAVVQIGTGYWLRTPVGKLHTDRYIPLHPQLKDQLDEWITSRPGWQASTLLLTDRGRPLPQSRVDKAVQTAATAAGLGHVHPHQLRHTLATQAINRGMSLEAIAALLGHHSLSMTMVYARIADRTVADEYFAVTDKVQALYAAGQPPVLPPGTEGKAMRALRLEADKRLLGNGYCARPVELDCHYETICEACTLFFTTIEFRPTLIAQRDDAAAKGQTARCNVYETLLSRLDQTST